MADVNTAKFPSSYTVAVVSLLVCILLQALWYIRKLRRCPRRAGEELHQTQSKSERVRGAPASGQPPPPQCDPPEDPGQRHHQRSKRQKQGQQAKSAFSHRWLLANLKGHSGQVQDMDYSSNGKYLATCADDRTVLLWDMKDPRQKEHKSLRINIGFDHTSMVVWSPDSKAFIIYKVSENCIEIYKVERKKDGMLAAANKMHTFDQVHHETAVGLGISCNGRFIMSCSAKTDLVIWDLKGHVLQQVDTYLMTTNKAKVSPCGKFVVVCGFTPDVKVMEVVFSKTGEFVHVKKAFDLSGHSSGVYDVAFDADSSHMATVSKDGTWRLYHTNIKYKKGESATLLSSGAYTQSSHNSSIALSPDAQVIAVASFNILEFYDASNGHLFDKIEEVFLGPITCIRFDSASKYVLVGGDRLVRIFHNVAGYATNAANCEYLLKLSQTSATKERLQKTLQECRNFLTEMSH